MRTKNLKEFKPAKEAKEKKKPKLDTSGVKKAARKAADQALLQTMATLPAGDAKTLKECIAVIEAEREVRRASTRREKPARTKLRAMKLELRHVAEVLKQRTMEPEEREAYVVGVAMIKEQLEMKLHSPERVAVDELKTKRENARAAMLNITGGAGDTGKEVGSGAKAANVANGNGKEAANEKAPEEPAKPSSAIPAKNEAVSAASFTPPSAVAH